MSKNEGKIPWLNRAVNISNTFQPTSSGHYCIYVILLEESRIPQKYALYVGMTGKTPAIRFQQHKDGYKDAPSIRRFRKIRLLPILYAHLHSLSEDEAARLESKLAKAFKEGGIPVYGGH